MALIDCEKCGKKVSDGSPYCPNCGESVARRLAPFEIDPQTRCLRRWRRARNAFIGVLIFLTLYGLGGVLFETHQISMATPILIIVTIVGIVITSRELHKASLK